MGEDLPQYPCVVLALQILAQSKELTKSRLLNNTISMHSEIRQFASVLQDIYFPEEQVAMWTLIIDPGHLRAEHGTMRVVCNMHGKYIDALRASVCFEQVYNLMYALEMRDLKSHIYLIPTLTAYPKEFMPKVPQ